MVLRRGPRNRPGLCIDRRPWHPHDQATSTYAVVEHAISLLVAMVAVRRKESGSRGIDSHHPDSAIASEESAS